MLYVSDVFGGAISDPEIVAKCGILDYLNEGDFIMADRGFTISDMLEKRRVGLNIPPFARGKKQFTEQEVMDTRAIANRRIIIERVIGRAKINKILAGVFPRNLWDNANTIIFNCFILCNIQKSIV